MRQLSTLIVALMITLLIANAGTSVDTISCLLWMNRIAHTSIDGKIGQSFLH